MADGCMCVLIAPATNLVFVLKQGGKGEGLIIKGSF